MQTIYKNIDLEPAKRLLDKHLQHKENYRIYIEDTELIIFPGVFCPSYTNTTLFLAKNIKVNPGEIVLDMFSGSGFLGIKAAKYAKSVVCVDKSKQAVECIKNNVAINGLSQKITPLLGDLFDPIKNEKYDVIIANPPLLPGQPDNLLETAILDPGLKTTERFINGVSGYLKEMGRVYLLFSDVSKNTDLGGLNFIRELSEKNGFTFSIIAEKPMGYETYYVLLLKKGINK